MAGLRASGLVNVLLLVTVMRQGQRGLGMAWSDAVAVRKGSNIIAKRAALHLLHAGRHGWTTHRRRRIARLCKENHHTSCVRNVHTATGSRQSSLGFWSAYSSKVVLSGLPTSGSDRLVPQSRAATPHSVLASTQGIRLSRRPVLPLSQTLTMSITTRGSLRLTRSDSCPRPRRKR